MFKQELPDKPSLLKLLCERCWIDFPVLAAHAGVERVDVTSVVLSLPVSPPIVKKVLHAYTALAQTGETYTMNNVDVKLAEHTTRPIVVLQMPSICISDSLQKAIAIQARVDFEAVKENIFAFDAPSGGSSEKVDALLAQLDAWYLTDQQVWSENIVCIHHVEEDIPWTLLTQIARWCQTYLDCIPFVLLSDRKEIVGVISLK